MRYCFTRTTSSITARALVMSALMVSSVVARPSHAAAEPQIPELERWETQMHNYGKKHCAFLSNPNEKWDPLLAGTYYDAERVYLQIADYTKDNSWVKCADAAKAIYRDKYVRANNGNIPGFWNFSKGMLLDYQRTKDPLSKEGLRMLSTQAAFARDNTPEDTSQIKYSREVAYAIMAYINAERAGLPRRTKLKPLVEQAFGHLEQWFVDETYPVKPFFVALTSEALISYYEYIEKDPRVVEALSYAATSMYPKLWKDSEGAFLYIAKDTPGEDPSKPAPDLNLLIAPLYGWLYKETKRPEFLEAGNRIFAAGVRKAYLENPKQFDQSYRWSFDYVRWVKEAGNAKPAKVVKAAATSK